jgi:hypothetical protein
MLFDKIRIGDIEEASKFYSEYFLHFMKKTHPDCWERKNVNFISIIQNPDFLRNFEYLIKSEENFQIFITRFERALYSFIYKIEFIDNYYSVSLKGNLSDLEDDIVENKINKRMTEVIKDRSSNNYNNYVRKDFVPKVKRDLENLKEKIPLLKNFNPTYTKKNNIDKKILRKFKQFIKDNSGNLDLGSENSFIRKFIKENLFPPMRFKDEMEQEIEFKSFNTKYLIWVFNKEGILELYENFLLIEGKNVIEQIIKDYNLTSDNYRKEVEELQIYLFHLGKVFSNYNYNNKNCNNSNQPLVKQMPLENINCKNYKEEEQIEILTTQTRNMQNIQNIQQIQNIISPINNFLDAALNPESYEKVYENYLNKIFDLKLDEVDNSKQRDIFSIMSNDSAEDLRINKMRIGKNKSNRRKRGDRYYERSRELDYILFDNLIKTSSSSDKEE